MPTRRPLPPWWILALLGLLAGFAWLTRHPDTEWLERAEEWPLLGKLATGFRGAYLPRAPDPVAAGEPEVDAGPARRQVEVVVVEPAPEELEARPYVWVQPGTPIRAQPEPGSAILATMDAVANLHWLERRQDWYRIRMPRSDLPTIHGWVYLEDYREPSPARLRQPDPVLPLAAAVPDPERLAAARRLMFEGGREESCGPHPLYTDVRDQELLKGCPALVAALEAAYRERYGLEPVSPPAEAILLFQRAEDYLIFRQGEGVPFESNQAHAIPARGYVALYQGERSATGVVGTLVHELTHLLNRRALGPALPPWLNEGMADDLAESRIDPSGSIYTGQLGGEHRTVGGTVVRRGGVASAVVLQQELNRGDLPRLSELLRLDPTAFHGAGQAPLHYALSSFWVRFLLSDFEPGLAAGFRQFLADVAGGETLTEQRLLLRLGRGWDELEPVFHIWVRLQQLLPPSETGADAADREVERVP